MSARDLSAVYDRFREAGLARQLALDAEEYAKARSRRRRRTAASASAALLAVAGIAWLGPFLLDTARIATRPGARRDLTLQDGSRAELNANTRISADFRHGRRTVTLSQGEAFFSVARDPARPFVVLTPFGAIRVTGTRFNVRLDEGSGEHVTLVDGRVQIEDLAPDSPPTVLSPGEEATISDHEASVRPLQPPAMEQVLAWRGGRIILTGMTLQDAAERFAQYNGVSIHVDSDVARLQLGGTGSLGDLDDFLKAVEGTNAASVIRSPDGSFRLSRN